MRWHSTWDDMRTELIRADRSFFLCGQLTAAKAAVTEREEIEAEDRDRVWAELGLEGMASADRSWRAISVLLCELALRWLYLRLWYSLFIYVYKFHSLVYAFLRLVLRNAERMNEWMNEWISWGKKWLLWGPIAIHCWGRSIGCRAGTDDELGT